MALRAGIAVEHRSESIVGAFYLEEILTAESKQFQFARSKTRERSARNRELLSECRNGHTDYRCRSRL